MAVTPEQREMFSRILGSASGKTLRKGARGRTVRALQLFLRDQGIELKADGIFGPQTQRALRQYQEQAGIGADGVAGGKTFKSIREAITPMPNLRPRPETAAAPVMTEPPLIEPIADSERALLETPPIMPEAPPVPEPMPPPMPAPSMPAPPVPLQATGQALSNPPVSISGTVPSVTGGVAPPLPGPEPAPPMMGQEFGNTFPPEAARGFEMAQERLGQVPGNRDLGMMTGDYTSAHDQLVRALSGIQEPGPPDMGMANSPLAGVEQYQPGVPDMNMANPGNDPRMAELMAVMEGRGMTPSGQVDPQRIALIRALLAR